MYSTKPLSLLLLLSLLLGGCASAHSAAAPVPAPDYWPTQGWRSAAPEAQGMDSSLLAQMLEDMSAEQVALHSLLVIRNGYLVTEAYFHPYQPETKIHVQSVTKSVIGALVGLAIRDGYIQNVDQPLLSFYPGRMYANNGKSKESIRLKHLLSMTSGLDCQEFSPSGVKMEQTSGWVQFMLDLPLASAPGKQFGYCNGNAHLLSALIEKASGQNTRRYANRVLFQPLGITPLELADWPEDPQEITTGGYGLHLTPLDLAKIALLYLQNGRWEDTQLLPPGWVKESTTQHVQKEDGSGYGYLWTVYPDQGCYAALGLGGQQVHIYPEKNLIVVVTAGLGSYAEAPEIEAALNEYILPAVKSSRPLAENPAAYERLAASVQALQNPVQPVPPLPQTALDISGSVYHFAENPFGWSSLGLVFEPGAAEAELYLNDNPVAAVGLDHLYRSTELPQIGKILLRGRWSGDNTFVVDYPFAIIGAPSLAELGATELRLVFYGQELEITIQPLIFGGEPFKLHGEVKRLSGD